MNILSQPPAQFQVVSTDPELIIRYVSSRLRRIIGSIVILISTIVVAVICISIVAELFSPYPNYLSLSRIPYIIFFAIWAYVGLWLKFGISESIVTHDGLTVIHKMRGITHQKKISASHISYFNKFLSHNYDVNTHTTSSAWVLAVMTNQKRSKKYRSVLNWIPKKLISTSMLARLEDRTVNIYAHGDARPVEWLGRVLADFYQVELR
jgi:hypothetical protein